jgi:hypothetical protein
MDTQNDIAQAIDAIRGETLTQGALDLLDRIIDRQDGSRLVPELIASVRSPGKSEEEAVSRAMLYLESFANTSQPSACVLMTYLWPIADDLYMHDVCDSIDLWISDCDSARVTNQLKRIALSEEDADTRRHYESLIENRSDAS